MDEGSGSCSPGCRALQFFLLESCLALLPEETEEGSHTWTKDVDESMDNGGVHHVWSQEALSCPWAWPLDRNAHGTWQLLADAVGVLPARTWANPWEEEL